MKSHSSPPSKDVAGKRKNMVSLKFSQAEAGTQSRIPQDQTWRLCWFNISSFTFEHNPTNYGVFKVVGAPEDVGGDTIWASAYEAYDRLSPVFQKTVDGLTATHRNPNFHSQAKNGGFELVQGPRGHPDNVVDKDADAYEVVQ